MAQWLGIAVSTLTKYFREETDATLRKRKFLAALNDRGLITTDLSGKDVEWRVQYLQNALRGFDESVTLDFSRVNRHQVARLDWRGYEMAESITDKETEMNKGFEAIIKLMSTKAMDMMKDSKQQLGSELYVDGYAAGNGTRFHGLESFSGTTGGLAASPVGNPSDNYGGLSTALGDFGGSWDTPTAWPDGTGSTAYDFWSPIVVDYTATLATASGGWTSAVKTWANTCLEALRFGLLHGRKNDDQDMQVDIVFLARNLYRLFVQALATEERINVSPSEGSSGLYKLGFTDITNFDGTDITWEFGTPANNGYGICLNACELMSLKKELVNARGPVFDEESQSYRFWLIVLANLRFETIRNFVFWKPLGI